MLSAGAARRIPRFRSGYTAAPLAQGRAAGPGRDRPVSRQARGGAGRDGSSRPSGRAGLADGPATWRIRPGRAAGHGARGPARGADGLRGLSRGGAGRGGILQRPAGAASGAAGRPGRRNRNSTRALPGTVGADSRPPRSGRGIGGGPPSPGAVPARARARTAAARRPAFSGASHDRGGFSRPKASRDGLAFSSSYHNPNFGREKPPRRARRGRDCETR